MYVLPVSLYIQYRVVASVPVAQRLENVEM